MLLFMKIILVLIINIFLSIIFGLLLIPYLKKKKSNQTISIYLRDKHNSKSNTPTMGGLIFIIPPLITILFLCFFNKINISYNFIIVIVTFIGYGIIGFIDDYKIIKEKDNRGLSESMKLFLQIILATFIFYLFLKGNNEPLIWIHTLSIKINIGWVYGIFLLIILTSSSNAVNITDGLDGLVGGLSIIALLSIGIITINTGWLEGYIEIAYIIFSIIGSLIGFLFYNSYPAKIFMGDTGSLALGSIMGILCILIRHELLLVIIGIVFVIETITCIIQRIYYKLTHKRIFPMTPIHHTFEKILPEYEVVKIFWLVGLIGSLISLLFGVWL